MTAPSRRRKPIEMDARSLSEWMDRELAKLRAVRESKDGPKPGGLPSPFRTRQETIDFLKDAMMVAVVCPDIV